MNWKRFIVGLSLYALFLVFCNWLPPRIGLTLFVIASGINAAFLIYKGAKTTVTCLLILALLNATTARAWLPAPPTLPTMTDQGVTYYDITAFAATNTALCDYSGAPYTRLFYFTLQTSTNLTDWQPSCTVTGWCNPHNVLLASYTNGVLAAASYGPVTPASPVQPSFWAECIVALIVIGIGAFIVIQLKKMCDRCLPPTATPVTPPATNQVHQSSMVTIPAGSNGGNDSQRFYRLQP